MKIYHNLLKDDEDMFLVKTTALINKTNPVVDRIMDHDTVLAVLMANSEGVPILTNTTVATATRYTTSMQRLGLMVQNVLMELDPFDEPLVFRIKTLKEEVLVAPHKKFNIVVVQCEKKTLQEKEKRKNIMTPRSDVVTSIL